MYPKNENIRGQCNDQLSFTNELGNYTDDSCGTVHIIISPHEYRQAKYFPLEDTDIFRTTVYKRKSNDNDFSVKPKNRQIKGSTLQKFHSST